MQKLEGKKKRRGGQERKACIYNCSLFYSKHCCHNSVFSLFSGLLPRSNFSEAQAISPTKNAGQQNDALTLIGMI